MKTHIVERRSTIELENSIAYVWLPGPAPWEPLMDVKNLACSECACPKIESDIHFISQTGSTKLRVVRPCCYQNVHLFYGLGYFPATPESPSKLQ